ncbi:MAG: DNA topoisomerase IV subunit A [Mycoplasma sp.]|nr:DNA topoisomerase IV subunit A [Mycoplasma sp.]
MSKSIKDKVLNQSLDTIMSDRFGRYSKYIIQDRALPDARDGLKPVQRRILYAMNDLGLTHKKTFKKSARIVGEVIGKYHPHGDSSIYEAMVRMSQDWKINMPLVTMHGNNGSIDDDPAAAMRYTEVRLSKLSSELLRGIKYNTVSFAPNFDDSESEPTVLPAGFPNLLVNGAKGIAAGYATEMPPHNLGEIIDASIAFIKNNYINLSDLMKYVKGPDFPTGGIVQGKKGIISAFEVGKGRMIIRSKVEINNSKTKPSIIVTEIPYGVIKSKLVRDIDEIRFNKSIYGIKEVIDETDRNGIHINIRLNPEANIELILNYLYKKTDLQIYYNYNNIAIKDRVPKLLSLSNLIEAFISHQRNVQTSKLKYKLDKDKTRHEIVTGLVRVAGIADQVIKVIRNAPGSKSGVVKDLIENFEFTQIQASAIAELRLYRLSSTDQSIYIKEKMDLEERIILCKKILNSEEEMNNYIISKLKEIKKEFATPRKTLIETEMAKIEIKPEDLIKNEDLYVAVTKMGYLKSFSNRAFESNNIVDFGMKEGDSLIFLEKTNTLSKLIVLCDDGKYIYIPVHQIKDIKFKSIGQHINDFASLNPLSSILTAFSISNFSLKANILMVTKLGKTKRVNISEFETTRYKKSLIAFKLTDEDKLTSAKLTNGNMEVLIISSNSKAVKYNESTIPLQGIKASGVIGISLNDNYVTGLVVAKKEDIITLATNKGGIKRMYMNKILSSSRSTKGKSLFKEVKSQSQIVIEGFASNPTSQVLFNSPTEITLHKVNKVGISDYNSGFSLIKKTKEMYVPKSFGFDNLDKNSTLLDIKNISDEEAFENAEKEIEKISQLSLDDILGDI